MQKEWRDGRAVETEFRRSLNECISFLGDLADAAPVVVGVSGGVDSMVLLELLRTGWIDGKDSIKVAHLNHGLREQESNADEAMVEKYCRQHRISFMAKRVEINRLADKHPGSVEMVAREVRHTFLADFAHRVNARCILLGHHADDQLETFFLRLFRGTNSQGLAGMRAVAVSPADRGLRLVRPMMRLWKREIRGYAKTRGVPFREDESNLDTAFDRNRIRHELMPSIEAVLGASRCRNLLKTMDRVRVESEALGEWAETWLPGERGESAFQDLPLAVRRQIVVNQLFDFEATVSTALIDEFVLSPQKLIQVNAKTWLTRMPGGRVKRHWPSTLSFQTDQRIVKTPGLGNSEALAFGRRKLRIKTAEYHGSKPPAGTIAHECFDAAKIGGAIVLRFWQPGDRYRPIGLGGWVKLQDAFTNAKVSVEERRIRLVAESAEKREIFWVEGLRISETFKLEEGTQQCLFWHWQ